ncbi:MAG: hypothetical protein LBC52_02415 [Treponema sp.]|jgi:hypothetical protein|nr:hypothetical protein [Treponema sp.]
MKTYFLAVLYCVGLFLNSCGEGLTDSSFALELPALPQAWEAVLGSPCWRIEWINEDGRKETMTVKGKGGWNISLPQTWVSAVSAFPFWPEKGLGPEIFKPAGAIFPYDASGGNLVLSWQGGVEAVLYWEMVKVCVGTGQESVEESSERTAVSRLPMNFNWPRFRRLFDDPSLNADVRADPWLADWAGIAAKIVKSGFDKRRLVPEARSALEVQVGLGPWIGASPFAGPLIFETTPVFSVRPTADTWVSREGVLRCNSEAWIFIKMGTGD